MVSGNDVNAFFTIYNSVISGISGICGILGFLGSIVLGIVSYLLKKKTDSSEKKIKACEIVIDNLKTENAQIAKIIVNYGLSLADTKEAAAEVFDEKTKNINNIYVQDNMPENIKDGDIWIGGNIDLDFGSLDKE